MPPSRKYLAPPERSTREIASRHTHVDYDAVRPGLPDTTSANAAVENNEARKGVPRFRSRPDGAVYLINGVGAKAGPTRRSP